MRRVLLVMGVLLFAHNADGGEVARPGMALDPDPHAQYEFAGPVGRRVEVNVKNWLVRAPAANPGLLAMLDARDRQPPPSVVPWAGEFVGKYLISAVQALRMSDDPELEKTVRAVVERLLASQADDGYLGPFPKDARLLGNWDLWGHYHVMLALLAWHERTGDPRALAACRKAADLVCKTYLDSGRRTIQAGSPEMNLAIIHALGRLYRVKREERYLRMMREIEKDWQQAGDYLRTGVAGVEFFRTPKPRWESLHDLQGLVELYQITGDERYRTAFLHHWHSMRRWDRRNSGAFSSGEQATGDPFQPTAIETCCTIAWMAVTLDALRLTGDPACADELELSTYNGMLGAQHPSGSWWTYSTPMGGVREASHHSIVFQARAGTPDLNCCSVNGPRGLGMLSEWALMRTQDGGLTVNYYGPMKATVRPAVTYYPHVGNTPGPPMLRPAVTIEQETQYPFSGKVVLRVRPEKPDNFALRLRIPGWSRDFRVTSPGGRPFTAKPGTYCEIRRTWQPGDEVLVEMDTPLRCESGDGEMFGRIAVYLGPVLLAYDQAINELDEAAIPKLKPAMLAQAMLTQAKVSRPAVDEAQERAGRFAPWLLVEIPLGGDRALKLRDFATVGSSGSRYASWLPAEDTMPPVPVPDRPADGAAVPAGRMLFTWRPPAAADAKRAHAVVVSAKPDFKEPLLRCEAASGWRLVVPAEQTAKLKPGVDYYWKVVARNASGETESLGPPKRFRVDPSLAPLTDADLSEYGEGPGGVLAAADLAGEPKPGFGNLASAKGCQAAQGPGGKPKTAVELDGRGGMLVYKLRAFPGRDYTLSVWFAHEHKEERLGQVASAWAGVMDDPLRMCVERGKLFARIEAAGSSFSTEGVAVEPGRWYHAAVVKSAGRLTLFVDGRPAASAQVPPEVRSNARDFALGGNPHYTGQSEHLACRVAKLGFYARAFSPQEVAELCSKQKTAGEGR